MKSRQKGKKKGCSKERVFGCDLQEHLLHSGQEGKGQAAAGALAGARGGAGGWGARAGPLLSDCLGTGRLMGQGRGGWQMGDGRAWP